jgi:hypothetical protein
LLEEQLQQLRGSNALQCTESNQAAAAAATNAAVAACESAASAASAAAFEAESKALESFQTEILVLRQNCNVELQRQQQQAELRGSRLQQRILDVEKELAAAAAAATAQVRPLQPASSRDTSLLTTNPSDAGSLPPPPSNTTSASELSSCLFWWPPVLTEESAVSPDLRRLLHAMSFARPPRTLPLFSPLLYILPSSLSDAALLLMCALLLAALVPRARQLQVIVAAAACYSSSLLIPTSLLPLMQSYTASLRPPHSLELLLAAIAAPLLALIGFLVPSDEAATFTAATAASAAAEHPAVSGAICALIVLLALKFALLLMKFTFCRLRLRNCFLLSAVLSAFQRTVSPLIVNSNSVSSSTTAASLCLAFLIVCPYFFPSAAPPNDVLRAALLIAVVPPVFALAPFVVIAAVRIACAVCLVAALRSLRRPSSSPHHASSQASSSAWRVCARRIVLNMTCIFLMLHQHQPVRPGQQLQQQHPTTAADAAAPVALLLVAVTHPSHAAAIVCLRLWLVPVVPPMLSLAMPPSVVIASFRIASALGRLSKAAIVAIAAAAWFGSTRLQQLIASVAAIVSGVLASAGQLSLAAL